MRNQSVSTPSSATRISTPVDPIIDVLMAPEKIKNPTSTTKIRNAMRQNIGPDHVHGQTGDQVVLIDVSALPRGDQHGGQKRCAASKDQAIDGNDDCRALQVLELGVLDLAIDLRQAFFAAHGQNRVAKCHENAEQAEYRHQAGSLQEAQRIAC